MLQRPIIESRGLALYWRVLQEIWRVVLVTGTGKGDTVAPIVNRAAAPMTIRSALCPKTKQVPADRTVNSLA